jgi:cell division septation protein DedD
MYYQNLNDGTRTAIDNARVVLKSVMTSRMKPADVAYANRLLAESSNRQLSGVETTWLVNFANWYDTMNPKFWNWWESGGKEETEALQAQSKAGGTRSQATTKFAAEPPKQPAPTNTGRGATPEPAPLTPEQEAALKAKKRNRTYLIGGLLAVAGLGTWVYLKRR